MKLTRRLLALCLVAVLLLSCSGLPAMADPDEESAGKLVLPRDTEIIEEEAFLNDAAIVEAVLPEGITEIRERAFALSSLQRINLPSSLTFIAEDAFAGANLTAVTAAEGTYAYAWAAQHGLITPDVVIDASSFPDSRFRAYVAEAIDADHDGLLSSAERNAVTKIAVPMAEIQSLAGIALFPNLKELDCTGNPLMFLYIGDNPQLERLILSGCNGIGSLDLSQNGALKAVFCEYCGLSELDVSQNPLLQDLAVNGNQLTALDVSHNPALRRLMCSENVELGALNVRGNPALERLDCFYCGLESLDVSQNPALMRLNCSDNTLGSLDLSQNGALEGLFCESCVLGTLDVSHNPNLKELDCANNRLTSLDLSANSRLELLYCGRNRLRALNVSRQTLLKSLSCESNNLASLDVSHNELMTNLICAENALSRLDVSGNPELWSLCCEGNSISALDITNCERLSLTYFRGTASQQESFAEYRYSAGKGYLMLRMPPNTAVTARFPGIDIDEIYFPDKNFRRYVAEHLDPDHDDVLSEEELATVTALDLSGLGIKNLMGLQYFDRLESLRCAGNPRALGTLQYLNLQWNTALRSVDLSYNPLSNVYIDFLPQLETLKLDGCLLEYVNIAQNPALRTLSVKNCRLSSLSLSQNSSLASLDCRGNSNLRFLDLRPCPVLLACYNGECSSDGSGGLLYSTPVTADCLLAIDEDLYIVSDPDAPNGATSYYSPTLPTNSVYYVTEERILTNAALVTTWASSTPGVAVCGGLETIPTAVRDETRLIINTGSKEGSTTITGCDEHGVKLLYLYVYVTDPVAMAPTGAPYDSIQSVIFSQRYGDGPVILLKDASYRFRPGESLAIGDMNGHSFFPTAARDCTLSSAESDGVVTYTCVRKPGTAVSLLRSGQIIARSDYLNDIVALVQDGDIVSLSGDAKADASCMLPQYATLTVLLNGHSVRSSYAIQLSAGNILLSDFSLLEGQIEVEYSGWPSAALRCTETGAGSYRIQPDPDLDIPHYERRKASNEDDFFEDAPELRALAGEIDSWSIGDYSILGTVSGEIKGIWCRAPGRAAAAAWKDGRIVAIVHYTVT